MRVPEAGVGSLYGEEEVEAVSRVLWSGGSLARGPERPAFEAEFAAACGARHALAVSSGTAALHLCAQILRLGPGDEVICTPQTFWATVVALVARGVTIRFADIDPDTLNIDPATIERHITSRTKAVYLVHHGGNPADLEAIRPIAAAHGLPVVEDCAHAPGASHRGEPVGAGDLCCFSFHSLKNMTTLGMGGMLTTSNGTWAEEAARLRAMGIVGEAAPRHGVFGPYRKPSFDLNDQSGGSWDTGWTSIEETGTNFGMGEVQAAVGRVQLAKLQRANAARAAVADAYDAAVRQIEGLRPLRVHPGDRSAWHLYTCFVCPDAGLDRDELARYLQEQAEVQIVLRFFPLHLHAGLQASGHGFGECPVCERVWFEQQLNLPVSPGMTQPETDYVCQALADGAAACRR